MVIFKKLCCVSLAAAVFFAAATGAFAANLGREQTREYNLGAQNISLTADESKTVEVPDVQLPFDAGSVKVTYANCTVGGDVDIYANGSKVSTTKFYGGSGQVEFAVTSDSGIKAGSAISFRTAQVAATITALTFYKENTPGADYYELTLENDITLTGGQYSNIEAFFPFNVGSVEFTYSYTRGIIYNTDTLTVQVNGKDCGTGEIVAGTNKKARVYFTSDVSPTNAIMGIKKSHNETYGGNVTITGIKLYKENKIMPDTLNADIEYTDYEKALQTASVFKADSNIYKSKNAIRYMSYENTDSAAFKNGDNLYVPVDAVAIALGLYKEEKGIVGATISENPDVPLTYTVQDNRLKFKSTVGAGQGKTMTMNLNLDKGIQKGEITFKYKLDHTVTNNRNLTVNGVNIVATGNQNAFGGQSLIEVPGFTFVDAHPKYDGAGYYVSGDVYNIYANIVVSRSNVNSDWDVKVYYPKSSGNVLVAQGTLPAANHSEITRFGLSRYILSDNESITVQSLSASLKDADGKEAELCSTDFSQLTEGGYDSTSAINGARKHLFRGTDNSEITVSGSLQNVAGDFCYPIKTVAEAFGYTAAESGDCLIIDKYKVRANEILGNSAVLNGLITEFGSYEATEVTGNTYYVSANVSASGDGSEASPFKTIQEAANRAKAGDRVVIKGGIYRETVTPANSGTAQNPIIFEAASGEQVTVSAFEEISGFKLYRDGIYVALLPTKLDFGSDFIMYGGDVLVEGRQPNESTSGIIYPSNVTSPLWHTKGSITTPNSNLKAESQTELSNGRDSALRNSTYVGFKGLGWEMAFGKVVSSFRGSATVRDMNQMNYFGASGALDWGYLTNSMMTLDMPGEWYAKNGVIYIMPPSSVSPDRLKVEAKQRYTTFDLTGRSCIQLKNINTIGGSILMGEGSELNIVNGGTHKYTSHFTYPFDGNDVSYGSFQNLVKGKSGNYVGGKNNAIINTCIDTGAGAGIILGGRYGYISGNTILDMSYAGLMEFAGILLASSTEDGIQNSGGHNIHFNTVCKTGRAALGNRTRYINDDTANERIPFIASEISYNDFSYSNLLARDSGIIYLHGCSMGNDLVKSEIHHNVLSNSVFNGQNSDGVTLVGAYADNYTANGIYHDNIVYYEGDFVYDKASYDASLMQGDELYIGVSAHVQGFERWGRTYSTFKAYNNGKVLHCENGFDRTDTGNFPSGKIFKYGA